MTQHTHGLGRASVGTLAALALVAGGASVLAVAAPAGAAAPAATAAAAAPATIDDATLTWGLSGYAQVGIFGPWTFKDLSGDVAQLTGSVSGGTQTEYVVAPVPATSMPVSSPQKTPNAVKFSDGTGSADPVTGAGTLEWDGSYTVNAYPAQFGAPDEIYSDPQLTTAADGSGELTMNFALGPGQDMSGNPVPAQDFGRITLQTFDAGSSAPIANNPDGFRLTPDYQGVAVTVPPDGSAQVTCTADGSATGWWGAWPQELISSVPASVRPHFYSTSCGGMQDHKPALPLDVDLNTTPSVSVSDTTLLPSGVQQVTVTGSGFYPGLATGTRPPLSGKAGGAYIVFGRFPDNWAPSTGGTRTGTVRNDTRWAVLAEDMATVGGVDAGAVELRPDGTFSATVKVDKAAVDALATTGSYGIYTYPGSGATQPLYETYTPLTFAKATPGVTITATNATYGADVPVTVTVSGRSAPTGDVVLKDGATTVGSAALVGGKATFTLTRPGAGAHALTASYAGDMNTEAGEGSRSVTVAKAVPAVGVTAADVSSGKDVAVSVTVPAAATGTVVLKEGADVLGTAPVTGGTATFTVADLATGEHALVASYAGDANHAAASGTIRVTVGQATGTAKVGWATRPTAGKRGTARLTVSEHATGKATVVLRFAQGKAKGKRLATLRVKVKGGVATVRLPKLGRGRYALVVKVPGNDAVTRATVTRTFRVK